MEFLTETFELEELQYFFDYINNGSVFYLIIPFFILELIRYAVLKKLNWNILGDSLANVVTVFAFIMIEFVLGALLIYQLYFYVYENISLPHLPLNIVTVSACILLADFAYYWDHRIMHRIGIGWATHTVHHSSPHFNMSVAYRFGPLDAVFPIFFSLPIVMLGFNPWMLLFVELFVQSFQAILHTEVIGKLPGPIEYIFNTPSHHRVHHGSNEKYLDKNYAGIFIIWDRMLGTFAKEEEKVVYGITQPLNSINPIKVFFHGFTRLYHQMKSAKGLRSKLSFLIRPPGWTPPAD